MRAIVLSVILAIGGSSVSSAQVINGEGTYEDSFLHTPPAGSGNDSAKPDETGNRAAVHKPSDPSSAETRARHRD